MLERGAVPPAYSTVLEPALETLGKQHLTAQHRPTKHLSSTPCCADAGAAFPILVILRAEAAGPG